MPRFTVKLETPHGPRYLEWSTVVDAPVTWGVTLDEYKRYYRDRYGSAGMKQLVEVLDAIDRTGCANAFGESADDVIVCNRAGKDETWLTLAQIVGHFCPEDASKRDETSRPVGVTPDDD